MVAGKTTDKAGARGGSKRLEACEPDGTEPAKVEGGNALRRAEVVRNMLTKIEAKISGEAGKTTVGDYIRLVQLEKELGEESPKGVNVRWVEPAEEFGKEE